ncbi:MAG TPA: hypothetical protein D7I00_04160, partial [Candidatus Poseidoniales archaeon]
MVLYNKNPSCILQALLHHSITTCNNCPNSFEMLVVSLSNETQHTLSLRSMLHQNQSNDCQWLEVERMIKQKPRWMKTIGRVAFMNCDPLFVGLDDSYHVLPAPPSWLTGHLLRKDCVLAPIPAADFAKHHDELALVPEIGICSKGEVGSVLVFGSRPLEEMRDIALPTDSSSSVALLKYLLKRRGIDPRPVEMGPDLDTMLERCDGALLIGDRALDRAKTNPDLVRLDLGQAWLELTGQPMVFGVFAARKDT